MKKVNLIVALAILSLAGASQSFAEDDKSTTSEHSISADSEAEESVDAVKAPKVKKTIRVERRSADGVVSVDNFEDGEEGDLTIDVKPKVRARAKVAKEPKVIVKGADGKAKIHELPGEDELVIKKGGREMRVYGPKIAALPADEQEEIRREVRRSRVAAADAEKQAMKQVDEALRQLREVEMPRIKRDLEAEMGRLKLQQQAVEDDDLSELKQERQTLQNEVQQLRQELAELRRMVREQNEKPGNKTE